MEIVRRVEEDRGYVPLAVRALGRIGPEASGAVPLLVSLLKVDMEQDDEIAPTPEALGRLGPPARAAVPALLKAAGSRREDIRAAAVLALGRLRAEGDAVLTVARRALEDEKPIVRVCAALALIHLGEVNGGITKTLSEAIRSPRLNGQRFLNAMEGFPDEAAQVVERLERLAAYRRISSSFGSSGFARSW